MNEGVPAVLDFYSTLHLVTFQSRVQVETGEFQKTPVHSDQWIYLRSCAYCRCPDGVMFNTTVIPKNMEHCIKGK